MGTQKQKGYLPFQQTDFFKKYEGTNESTQRKQTNKVQYSNTNKH